MQAGQREEIQEVRQEGAVVQQAAARLYASETQLQQIVMDQQTSLATASKVQVSCATLL